MMHSMNEFILPLKDTDEATCASRDFISSSNIHSFWAHSHCCFSSSSTLLWLPYGTPNRTLMPIFWYQKMIFWYQKFDFLISEIILWYQKIGISDIRKYMNFWYQKILPIFWYQKMIFWYQKLISDIGKSFSDIRNSCWFSDIRKWCSDIRNWFSDIRNWFFDKNHFLISQNHFLISEKRTNFWYQIISWKFWYQKIISDISNSSLFSDIRYLALHTPLELAGQELEFIILLLDCLLQMFILF